MENREISEILKSNVPIPAKDIPKLFEMLVECKKEMEITKREENKYDSIKDVMIQEITGKYTFYEFLFSKIFHCDILTRHLICHTNNIFHK